MTALSFDRRQAEIIFFVAYLLYKPIDSTRGNAQTWSTYVALAFPRRPSAGHSPRFLDSLITPNIQF